MKKSLKAIFSLTLVFVMCLSLCAGAFAEENCADVPTTAGDAVYITKDLKIARYTTVPEVCFTFSFTPYAAASSGLQSGESCPAVTSVSVSYSAEDGSDISSGKVSKTAQVCFPEFSHAGVYAYKVTESGNFTPGEGEELINDEAYYIVRVYVVNCEGGTEIEYVTVEKFDGPCDFYGKKVEVSENGELNGFKFVNTYTKCADGEDGVSLVISKEVEGKYADRSRKFSYTLTVTSASTAKSREAFTYSVAGGQEQQGVCGRAISFTLSDGDSIVLKGLTAGASYDITENGEKKYTPSALVTVNGGQSVNEEGIEGRSLTLCSKGIGENENTAEFTNTYDDGGVTPTGIIINNLPYIMLVVLAGAGLFIFAFSAKRREQEG